MPKNSAPGFDMAPDYRLELDRSDALHQIIYNETIIAASRDVIVLHETGCNPIAYFPEIDIDQTVLEASAHQSFCEFKGRAAYWSIVANGREAENAAWSYPDPFDEFAPLANRMAFYLDRLTCYWVDGKVQPLVQPGWTRPDVIERVAA